MAKEFFYPDWIQKAYYNFWFEYNPETKSYKYNNVTKPHKNYKFIFDPIEDGVKRGDLLCFTKNGIKERGYRNEGVWIWNGDKMVELYTNVDIYGSVPREFKVGKEFAPDHWIDKIDHNNIVWLENELYKEIKLQFLETNNIEGNINIKGKDYSIKIDILDDDNDYLKSALKYGKLKVNDKQIQLVYKRNDYKLYHRTYDITLQDTTNRDNLLEYIKNNNIYIQCSENVHEPKSYYINYNNTCKYFIDIKNDIKLVKKNKETILNQMSEYLINYKPHLEYFDSYFSIDI